MRMKGKGDKLEKVVANVKTNDLERKYEAKNIVNKQEKLNQRIEQLKQDKATDQI